MREKLKMTIALTILISFLLMSYAKVPNVQATTGDGTNQVNLILHNGGSALTHPVGGAVTSANIMNTTETWYASAQSEPLNVTDDDTLTSIENSTIFYLYPDSAAAITIDDAVTTDAFLYLKGNVVMWLYVNVTLYELDVAGTLTELQTVSENLTLTTSTAEYEIDSNFVTSDDGVAITCSIAMNISYVASNVTDFFTMYYDASTTPSRCELALEEHIVVSAITRVAPPPGNIIKHNEEYIISLSVSDDLGAYDVYTTNLGNYFWARISKSGIENSALVTSPMSAQQAVTTAYTTDSAGPAITFTFTGIYGKSELQTNTNWFLWGAADDLSSHHSDAPAQTRNGDAAGDGPGTTGTRHSSDDYEDETIPPSFYMQYLGGGQEEPDDGNGVAVTPWEGFQDFMSLPILDLSLIVAGATMDVWHIISIAIAVAVVAGIVVYKSYLA